jgi:hypothetical protein
MPTLAALHKARPSRSVSIFLSVIVAALPTQGSSTLSTNAPLEQFVESGESGGISILAER